MLQIKHLFYCSFYRDTVLLFYDKESWPLVSQPCCRSWSGTPSSDVLV